MQLLEGKIRKREKQGGDGTTTGTQFLLRF
jgi:hypothetical protein